jgi:hypothetical protein
MSPVWPTRAVPPPRLACRLARPARRASWAPCTQGVHEALATLPGTLARLSPAFLYACRHVSVPVGKKAGKSRASNIAKASAEQGARCRQLHPSGSPPAIDAMHCDQCHDVHGRPSSAACAPPCSAMGRQLRRLEACSRPELTSGHPRLSARPCLLSPRMQAPAGGGDRAPRGGARGGGEPRHGGRAEAGAGQA